MSEVNFDELLDEATTTTTTTTQQVQPEVPQTPSVAKGFSAGFTAEGQMVIVPIGEADTVAMAGIAKLVEEYVSMRVRSEQRGGDFLVDQVGRAVSATNQKVSKLDEQLVTFNQKLDALTEAVSALIVND